MKQPNIITAIVAIDNKVYHIANNAADGHTICHETGNVCYMTRREFRKFIKEHGGKINKPLKLGEYINIHTGEVEKLWGL